ncbi:hypothetical protein A4A49_06542 [Nicotiana attenuata]|uniref:DUF4283 domain-containing protein n=1 Tax=Nicotiana attenuata TaxID=49451 RepID=A0A1J6HTH3_NICAT|nr:hypothetical protein A4A49_06542 [Nicotiana attenuata]
MMLDNDSQSINDKEAQQTNGRTTISSKLGDQALNHSQASHEVINGIPTVQGDQVDLINLLELLFPPPPPNEPVDIAEPIDHSKPKNQPYNNVNLSPELSQSHARPKPSEALRNQVLTQPKPTIYTINPNPTTTGNLIPGKELFLDLTSFQKTRGSVAKIKMQIDLTKYRLSHVWLGFDEDRDVNGDGKWLEVQYESLPEYCSYYKHLGHLSHVCPKRLKEENMLKWLAISSASGENNPNISTQLKLNNHHIIPTKNLGINSKLLAQQRLIDVVPIVTQKGNISDTVQRVKGIESRSETIQRAPTTSAIHSDHREHVSSQVDVIPLKNIVHEKIVTESCHLKKFSPSGLGEDEYNHMKSEDKVDFGDEADDEHNVDLEEEDTCNQLLTAINGAADIDKMIDSHGLSPRSKPPHYLTRSKASSIKAPPKSITPK